MATAQKNNTKEPIEKQLWKAADKLRKNIDAAGYHSVRWNGKDRNGNGASSGIYLYQLQAGTFTQVRKMSLLR